MSDNEHIYLLEQVERCRRLAAATSDERTATILRGMADEFEARARALESIEIVEIKPEPPAVG